MGQVESAYFSIRRHAGQFDLIFAPTLHLTGGSASRAHFVLQRVRRLFKREGLKPRLCDGQLRAIAPLDDEQRLSQVLITADAILDKIAARPLEPHEVREALQITSLELKRWTKARRLPISGQGSFRKGQDIFSTATLLPPSRNSRRSPKSYRLGAKAISEKRTRGRQTDRPPASRSNYSV
jgi:hypothetical protein